VPMMTTLPPAAESWMVGLCRPRRSGSDPTLHPERASVHVEQRLLLLDLRRLLFADTDELAQHLDVEAGGLGLGVDILDVAAERLALLLEPLDAVDQTAQTFHGDAAGLHLVRLGVVGFLLDRIQGHPAHPRWSGKGGGSSLGAGRRSMTRIRLDKGRLLLGGRILLEFLLPFLVGYPVDDLARVGVGKRHALLLGGLAIPAREAVAAEARQIHQIDVLHVRALAQMFDQAAEGGGFELGAGRIVELRDSHRGPPGLLRRSRWRAGGEFAILPASERRPPDGLGRRARTGGIAGDVRRGGGRRRPARGAGRAPAAEARWALRGGGRRQVR